MVFSGERLASHALWIERRLHLRGGTLCAAFVEAVATEPAFQRRGFATSALRALAGAIAGYDVGALSPSDVGFYQRLDWERWRGPLWAIRDDLWVRQFDETAMILRTGATPPLDLDADLAVDWREGEVW